MKCISLIAGLIAAPFSLFSQVNGIVIDRHTNQPVNVVAIAAQGTAIGTYSMKKDYLVCLVSETPIQLYSGISGIKEL